MIDLLSGEELKNRDIAQDTCKSLKTSTGQLLSARSAAAPSTTQPPAQAPSIPTSEGHPLQDHVRLDTRSQRRALEGKAAQATNPQRHQVSRYTSV